MERDLFSEIKLLTFVSELYEKLKNEIEGIDPDQILRADAVTLVQEIVANHRLDIPILHKDKLVVHRTAETKVPVNDYGRTVIVDGCSVIFDIPFEGDGKFFGFQPSTYFSVPPIGNVELQHLFLTVTRTDQDGVALKKDLEIKLGDIDSQLDRLRKDAVTVNQELEKKAASIVSTRKQLLQNNRAMVESLNIPVKQRPGAEIVSVVRKKIPLPDVASFQQGQPKESYIEMATYEFILSTIESMTKVMERSPRAFSTINEEALRHIILFNLNNYFEGQATGETFNFGGKTDILIRVKNKNIFIAECKFWKGPKSLLATIDQLMGYTSWGDTKTAIIIFNRGHGHSDVLKKVQDTMKNHQSFKRELPAKNETHFRYQFSRPDDVASELHLTVLVLSVPTAKFTNKH